MGISSFESSIGGLGGCPFAPGATGNICTEDLVNLLHEMDIQTGIDLEQLLDVSLRMEAVVGHALPGQVMKAGPRTRLHPLRSEEHTSELQSLMRSSYAVFCLNKTNNL